jgi:hypothetical protein
MPSWDAGNQTLVTAIVVLVHEIYQREKVDDVMQWRDAVKFPEA